MENVFKVFRIIALVAVIGFSFAACEIGIIDDVTGGDDKTLTGITVSTLPAKTQYNTGDTLDTKGMVVTATFKDGSKAPVTGYTTSGFTSQTLGEKTVIVTYQGKTATFKVTVNDNTKPRVAKPAANPASGTLVTSGAIIVLSVSTDGADIWYTTNGSAPAKNGSGSFKYGNPFAIAAPPVTVKAIAVKEGWTDSEVLEAVYASAHITVADISITAPANGATPATEVANQVQERFTSGTVTWSPSVSTFLASAEYTATVTLTARTGYTFTGINNSNVKVNGASATTVSVASTGNTLTLTYKFPATGTKAVRSIAIKTQATKLTYTHGDTLDLTGLVVTLTYNDNTTEDVPAASFGSKSITAAPANGIPLERNVYNNTSVRITYGNFTPILTSDLTVNQGNASTFTITPDTIPNQTYSGTAISVTFTVSYPVASGTAKELVQGTDYTVAYTNNTNAGQAAITITGTGNYTGTKTVNFTIDKANPVVTWPTLSPKPYTAGLKLSDFNLNSGQAAAGTFAWDAPNTELTVGTQEYEVTFTPNNTNNYNTVTGKVSVTVISGSMTDVNISIGVPSTGATPAASVPDQTYFTGGSISWSPNDNPFKANTVYTASVILTAKTGYTFTGINNSNVKVNGAAATSVTNSGATLILTRTFTATGAKTVTGIAIKSQPGKLSYTHGEALDLSGLEVTLTYNDNTSEDVAVAGFGASGVTANPSNGAALVCSTHNGTSVNITSGSGSATTSSLTVAKANASNFTIVPSSFSAVTYSGSAITPTFTTVSFGSLTPTSGTDYTVTYSGNTNAGTATITITGIGANYEGTKTVTFTINPISVAGSSVEIDPIDDETYTGTAFTPDVTVRFASGTLTEDTDYTVEYTSTTNAGQATVTIAGKAPNFTGSTTVHFNIAKANPVITTWPSASSITNGQKLSASNLSGSSYTTAGNFAWQDGEIVPVFGSSNQTVIFTPTDTNNYNTATNALVNITVTEAPITIATITITAPATGAAPTNTVSNVAQERFDSGTVAWYTGSDTNTAFSGNQFLGSSVYTATVTLSAHTGYTFTGINNASVTINGSAATVVSNQGSSLHLSYTFATTNTKIISSFVIKTQPSKLTGYTHGDKLELAGLVVTLTYNDSSTEDVAVANFGSYSITPSPSDGTRLDHKLYDGKPVVITVGGINHNTNILSVAQGNASTFIIEPSSFTAKTYTGEEITVEFTVKYPVKAYDGEPSPTPRTLNSDEYTVSYNGTNVNVGNATLTITPIANGDYTGTKVINNIFAITTLDISTSSAISIVAIADQEWTGNAITPTITVKNNGVAMATPADYTVQVTNNTNRGQATVTITGAGNNYTGTKTANFNIVAKSVSGLTIEAIYTPAVPPVEADPDDPDDEGTPGTPESYVVTVKDSGRTLTLTTDYTQEITPAVGDTPASVTITGANNYTGTKSENFVTAGGQRRSSLPSGSKTSSSSWK